MGIEDLSKNNQFPPQKDPIEPTWGARMDIMEDAAKLRGKFFAKVGNVDEQLDRRGEHRDGEAIRGDTRALILRAPIREGNKTLYVVITRDGAMTIQHDPTKGDEIPKGVLRLLQTTNYDKYYKPSREKYGLTLPELVEKISEGKDLFNHNYSNGEHAQSGYLEKDGERRIVFGFLDYNKKDTGLDPNDRYSSAITCGEVSYAATSLADGDLLQRAIEESFKIAAPPQLPTQSSNLSTR